MDTFHEYRQRVSRQGRRLFLMMAGSVTVTAAIACQGDNSAAPTLRSPATTLGAVRVAPLNAIVAVGDTLRLSVTGRSLTGVVLASLDSVEYVLQNLTDSVRVRLSASGVITALTPSGPRNPVMVQVIGFKDGLALADVAVIQITQTAIAGATLSIQPSDSARLAVGNDRQLNPVIKNPGTNESVNGPAIRYELGPGDSTAMSCFTPDLVATATITLQQLTTSACGGGYVRSLNTLHANLPGVAWVYANVTVYGVPLRDSVMFVLTNSFVEELDFGPYELNLTGPATNTYIIAPGGIIYFVNSFPSSFGASVTWTFETPDGATATNPSSGFGGTSGNITPISGGEYAIRQFLTAGTYKWTATVTGGFPPFTGATTTGSVIVQ